MTRLVRCLAALTASAAVVTAPLAAWAQPVANESYSGTD